MREARSEFVEGELSLNGSDMMQNKHEVSAWSYAITWFERKLFSRLPFWRPLSSFRAVTEKGLVSVAICERVDGPTRWL